MKEGVVDADAFLKLVDTSKVKHNEDGTFEGLTELFTASKESMPYMYNAAKPKGITPPKGEQTKITKEDFAKLGYVERTKLYNDDPELFAKLTE